MNLVHFADLLIMRENNSRIRFLFRESAVHFRVIGNWQSSGNQEYVKFGNLVEPQFGNHNKR
jgi:hypothetical protein